MSRIVCIAGYSNARNRDVVAEKRKLTYALLCDCILGFVQELEAELKNQADAAATKLQQMVRYFSILRGGDYCLVISLRITHHNKILCL